jgi:GR25 family glycosyltransferase involved in LPS biosynthesis
MHCYCINRADRPDRREHAQSEFDRIGLTVEFIDAVIGDNIDPIGKMTGPLIGLSQTVLNIINDAIDNDYDVIRIFEDDILFLENYNYNIDDMPEYYSVMYTGFYTFYRMASISENLCHVDKCFLGHDITVKKSVLQQWKIEIEKFLLPPDGCLAKLCYDNNIKCCGYVPNITTQRSDYSDILCKYVDQKSTL